MVRSDEEGIDEEGTILTDDELEAHTVKYNVARIVRLSSGNFALFACTLRVVQMGDHVTAL